MGLAAFVGFLLAVVAYWVTFCFIKANWRLPVVLNAVGAIFMSACVVMFWQFLTNGMWRTNNFPMPEVPISVPVIYAVLSVSWYVVTIQLCQVWRNNRIK